MNGVIAKRTRQISNLYWIQYQLIGLPVSTFRQIIYLPFLNAVLDFDQVLAEAKVDCGRDLHNQLIEYGGAAKVWTTSHVKLKPVNFLANKRLFKQYLNPALTRIFRRKTTLTAF